MKKLIKENIVIIIVFIAIVLFACYYQDIVRLNNNKDINQIKISERS